MIITIIIWIYMLIASYILGFEFISEAKRVNGQTDAEYKNVCYILTGIGILTVYSEFFSLFYKVGLTANIVLIVLLILAAFKNASAMKENLENSIKAVDIKLLCATAVVFILFAYATSHGYMHYDSDLYHAQSIRWIEEYGVVKGLGNLHTRLAYNSAAFCLTALFSGSFILGQSYHVCAGFLAFILAVIVLDLFTKKKLIKPYMSGLARVVAVYYLLNVFDEIVSPASDYFMVLMTLSTVILYLDLVEEKSIDATGYALLSLFSLIIISFKISGAWMVLICIYPAYLLIKDKNIKSIVFYVLSGFIFMLPLFIRNIILSGYLVYPAAGLDLFSFDFKIPKGVAEYDAKEIEVYGRGYSDVGRFDEGMNVWIKDWFTSLGAVDKASFVLSVLSLIALVTAIVYAVKKRKDLMSEVLLILTVSISFVFWFMTSPNIRYGCVFLYLTFVMNFGFVLVIMTKERPKHYVYTAILGLFFLYKAVFFVKENVNNFTTDYILRQQDYGKYEAEVFKMGDTVFYNPKEGDRIGYDHFPSAPIPPEPSVLMMGDTLKDGFINTNK